MRHANFKEIQNTTGLDAVVIRDIGPWDAHPTVTNDAEWVVETLSAKGSLPEGRRLFYVDSDGQMDELLVDDGKFAGFAAGPGAASAR